MVFKLDRRLVPEEDPARVEASLRDAIVRALQRNAPAVFSEPIPVTGTPLYTDVRLYSERGIPPAISGAGPRSLRESNAKRADEHVRVEDLRGATKAIARTLLDLLLDDVDVAG